MNREEAEKLAKLNWTYSIQDRLTTGEIAYVAMASSLPGCMAQGVTRDETLYNLEDAKVSYIESMLDDGMAVTMPTKTVSDSVSGDQLED